MKHIAKRSLSMLLALVMLCSLCVNALAADEVKVNSALSATELEKSASAQTVRVTVAPASAVTVSNYEVKLEVPKGWTITKIENDDPTATLTAADYNLANGQMGWTSADAEDKSVSKFVTYTVEIPANTAAGTYELKVTGVNAWKNYAQDAVLTKGQHDSTLTLTVKEKTTATGYTAELSTWYTQREVGQTLTLPVYITSSEASVTTWNAATAPGGLTQVSCNVIENFDDESPDSYSSFALNLILTSADAPVYFNYQDGQDTTHLIADTAYLQKYSTLLGLDSFADWQYPDWRAAVRDFGVAAYCETAQLYLTANCRYGITLSAASMTPQDYADLDALYAKGDAP